MEIPKPVVAELVPRDNTPTKKDVEEVVENIVVKWNDMVVNIQNTTIRLCLMVKEMLKDYPDGTIKEILSQVKSHPDIKKFVSIDRIWQGMRLINKRPDLIKYHETPAKERETISDKPYIKKDGEIFWEFYFELAKQPLSDSVLNMIEIEGKNEKWSYRQLREKLQDAKDEMEQPCGFESRKRDKYELIRKIASICKNLPVEKLKDVSNYCEETLKNYNFKVKR